MNKVKLGKEILAELRQESNKGVGTYEMDKAVKPIAIEDYTVKVVSGAYGDWRKVEFSVEGQDQPFSLGVKGNRTIDEDSPVMIRKYVAKTDFTTSSGSVIKAGTTKWFATQS